MARKPKTAGVSVYLGEACDTGTKNSTCTMKKVWVTSSTGGYIVITEHPNGSIQVNFVNKAHFKPENSH